MGWMKSMASVQWVLVALLWINLPNSLLKAWFQFCLSWRSNLSSERFLPFDSYIWWTICILCKGMFYLWNVGLFCFHYHSLERFWAILRDACCSRFISLSKFELCFEVRVSGVDVNPSWFCRWCRQLFVIWLVLRRVANWRRPLLVFLPIWYIVGRWLDGYIDYIWYCSVQEVINGNWRNWNCMWYEHNTVSNYFFLILW